MRQGKSVIYESFISAMLKKILQILLSSTALTFIITGCDNRSFNPPSDEDMIRNFHAHEDAFNEIVEILPKCPYGDIYPPFYPIERAKDSLCLASLGPDMCDRLDSLLDAVGCERVYFKSRHTLWQIKHRDYDSIPPVEELPDTIVSSVYIMYYCAGWSIGPSVDKQYVYKPENQSTDICDGDLNKLIEQVDADTGSPGGMASKHIKGDWYIELWYDK